MLEFVDQMNNTIRLSEVPRRIVSLVPSQTELLFTLGLGDRVVGITKFCIHPNEWFRSKTRVGGTKDISFDKVKALNPDLIIGNKEENEKSNIEELRSIAPIWMSDIFNLEDSLNMIKNIGELLDVSDNSNSLIEKIKTEFLLFNNSIQLKSNENKLTVLYLIWRKPFISAGKNTFIDDMINQCGFTNFMNETRYPEVELNENKSPNFVFLSSEPYPFKENHVKEIQLIFPNSKVILVDGEMFSWYGSRLVKAPRYLTKLITNLGSVSK